MTAPTNNPAIRVSDVMVTDPLTVSPDTEIRRVVRLLIEHDLSGALVTDKAGFVVGVVTERDCIAVAADAGYYGDWGGPVSRYMSTSVESVHPNDNLFDVAMRMTRSPHRRFPVIEQGRLVGLLSRRDVLLAINKS